MITIRSRTIIPKAELDEKVGKIITDDDYNVLLTGPTRVLKPNGEPLCVYLPGVLKPHHDAIVPILRALRQQAGASINRGRASGYERQGSRPGQRTKTPPLRSYTIGAVDPMGQMRYCRFTTWTAAHQAEFAALNPFLREVSAHLQREVPDRFAVQMVQASRTRPEWVIAGTPFTTLTVNLSYPTGVHTDKGDLESGFSTISCFRTGSFDGGRLAFPKFRVAVDLQDGDLILMDAHEHHGNTRLTNESEDAERITVVAYYRTKMCACGSAREESAKAHIAAERRSGLRPPASEEGPVDVQMIPGVSLRLR